MTETETTSKLAQFISKYWLWLVAFFGIVGIIAFAWYLYKRTKTTEKAKQ
jgi:type II secretory pathway component PulF